MRKVLAPLIHHDTYTRAVEVEINRYFAEVIFGPMVDILEEAGIVPDENDQERQNASDAWVLFPAICESLGFSRSRMPQIHGEDRPALINYLAGMGVTWRGLEMPKNHLRPTQAGYYPEKVAAAKQHTGADRPILVSADNYILDGHHQWTASVDRGEESPYNIPVIKFSLPILRLMSLVEGFEKVEHHNEAVAPLKRAIASGKIWYADGEFTGQFSAATSRELRRIGATWSPARQTFRLDQSKVPFDLRNFIYESKEKSTALHKKISGTITEMEKNIAHAATGIEYAGVADKIISDLQKQFFKTVKGLDMVSVEAQINPGVRHALTEKLTNNANLGIKNFAAEKLPELRARVEMNVLAGGRADKLAKIIEVEYGISKRKAAFIAGQETSLLLSKYREERAKDIGSTTYVWRARHDSVTRPDHLDLDGTVQSWDNPPVTDKAAGRRCNPGCDFGCRCSASPIVNYIPAIPPPEPVIHE